MNKAKLNQIIMSIESADRLAFRDAMTYIDNLTKPIGSLGYMELMASKIASIKGFMPKELKNKNIIIMCSDNGVVEEGISSCPEETTALVTENFTKEITGVKVLSNYYGAELTVVDVGVNHDFKNPKIINKKIGYGTKNMMKGRSMSIDETLKAIEIGMEIVEDLKDKNADIIGTGEMGICNTATSAAVFCALTDSKVDKIVGKGGGVTELQYENKKRVIKKAIEINDPNKEDVIDVLSKVGGYDIAALCGCFLAAARYKIPIVIDGFISSVAALCAYRLNPFCKDYMFPSHLSAEPGASYIMQELGLSPILNLNMRLGEGSACPIAFSIIEASLYTMNNMGTFEAANLDKKNYVDIR
ncbi:nicotinate-nucleotide--dimethylbenzimidazole phosphoribosyltransferase [Clostridium algidicarnis]|uniref:nicotinate-nucleotide--dimethylbenzimidazole phosphoribosyltransferase n=1 Tax=Clostridium algidicarnis TaxID=37659 RepID=UPI001C0C1528|nr:nicotinate-nucleotide--dimethylbenzimidazole phosphoribosyltransferase [Clostridium algidicarnis]MBU3195310.1 nicotinate-nucleotide--dimethylbenzimidazole phosphoribosyltransferase [Clostridium algidicarnis]MBU3208269.1 nicotinate-nucleotide--dimethylbenzimidazole phosphoribosyltransferase [Clostridium algidicarnis]MBU3227499.1 nicotinate-nucleotide--dimethylbenzimidazole phosphoribosyltransferase [Clostridium algidicarnis]MBU3251094.1 nicotinate-nucleotide--dimethylbenzimidazole phosphoribo